MVRHILLDGFILYAVFQFACHFAGFFVLFLFAFFLPLRSKNPHSQLRPFPLARRSILRPVPPFLLPAANAIINLPLPRVYPPQKPIPLRQRRYRNVVDMQPLGDVAVAFLQARVKRMKEGQPLCCASLKTFDLLWVMRGKGTGKESIALPVLHLCCSCRIISAEAASFPPSGVNGSPRTVL